MSWFIKHGLHGSITAALVCLVGACGRGETAGAATTRSKGEVLAERLRELQRAGISLRPGVPASELLQSFDETRPPVDQFVSLLGALGTEPDGKTHPTRSPRVCTFDFEGLEKRDCEFLALRIREMIGDAPPIRAVEVTTDYPKVWLRFTIEDESHSIRLLGKGPDLAKRVLTELARVLARGGAGRQLYRVAVAGDTWIVGAGSRAELERLRSLGVSLRVL